MIEVKGGFEVTAIGHEVLDFLQSPKNLSQCLPNLQEFKEMDQNSFQATFKVELPRNLGISYLQNLNVRMIFTTSNAPDGVVLRGEGRSAGVRMRISLNVRVVAKEGSSMLEYEGQVDAGIVERLLGRERLETMTRDISSSIMTCISKLLQNGRRSS